MTEPNLFQTPPPAPEERFETIRSGSGFRLERIVSYGQTTPPGEWYDQDQAEWVAVLQGAARLRFADEDRERNLQPGDTLWIAAHRRHRVEWTQADPPTIWLALHLHQPEPGDG